MMTAEQFYWKDWHTLNPNVPGESMILRMCRFAEAYHRAESAAQLAEKEREIARLNKLFCDLTPGGSEFAGDPDYCAKYLRDRANTQTDLLKKKFIELRQREAELEQRWIAVADKLPEIGQFVVAIAYGRVHERTLYRREFSTYDGKRWTWQGLNGIPANHVTYWQPLPSPPKVQP